MITNEEMTTYVKGILEEYFNNSLELANLTRDYHSELYYDNDASNDIDVTILNLSGDIQSGVTQHPIQIVVDCRTDLKDKVITVLQKLAEYYNEANCTVGGISCREFYKTPVVNGKFQKSNISDFVSISLEANIFEISNFMNIESLKLDGEEIKFVNFGLSYVASTNSSGGINLGTSTKEAGQVGQSVQSAANTFVFTAIPKETDIYDKLLIQALTCKNQNQNYELRATFHWIKFLYNASTKDSFYEWASTFGTGKYVYTLETDESGNSAYIRKFTAYAYSQDNSKATLGTTYYMPIELLADYKATQISYTKDLQGFPIIQVTLMRSDS